MSTSPVEGDQPMSWCEKIPEAFYNGPINGSIKYSVTAGDDNDHFTIDEDTGEICNKVELDREDIAEYNLLISTFIKNGPDGSDIISSNRKSSIGSADHYQDLLLSELCVLIKVEDINDNLPRFRKDIYAIGIYHDIPPGTIIIKVTADDDDIGNNSALLYELQDNLSQFAVQQWSGMFYLTEQLNADESSAYEFFVKATDNFGNGLSSPFNTKVKIMTTSIKNTIIMTSSLSEMYIKHNSQEIISDLQEHLKLDVAILSIGPSLSEDQVMFVDLTDIWFSCTYPQTHNVVPGDHIMNNPLTDDFKSKWSINGKSLGNQARWKSVEQNASTTATWLIILLGTLLVLAIAFIIILILIIRQKINSPFLKWLECLKSKAEDNPPVIQTITMTQPFNFPRAHELKMSDITMGESLGEGQFGSVEKAKLRKLVWQTDDIDVAVKSLKREKDETIERRKAFNKELNVVSSMDYHPNVIKCIGFVTEEDPMLFVFEFAPQGDLKNYLQRQKGVGISKHRRVKFILDVANGMAFLSAQAIIHRDLAARNVLVCGETCKIADFGLSRLGAIYEKVSQDKIPILWTAPECLVAQEAIYNTKTDVWSFGVLMWEIMSYGETPYSEQIRKILKEHLDRGVRLGKPNDCPNEIYSVMQKCWKKNQNERPSFRRLVDDIDTIHHELAKQDDGTEPQTKVYDSGHQFHPSTEYDDIIVDFTSSDQSADGIGLHVSIDKPMTCRYQNSNLRSSET